MAWRGPPWTQPPAAPSRRRRRRWFLAAGLGIALVALVSVGLRYAPLVEDVRAVRAIAQRLEARTRLLEPSDLERATLEQLRSDVQDLESRLRPLRQAIDDPIGGIIQALPLIGPQVTAAASLLDAADSLVEVGYLGLGMAERAVAMREANEADPSSSLMRGLTEIMATSAGDVDRMSELIEAAREDLGKVSADAPSQLLEVRDSISRPLDRYGPLLGSYREIDDLMLDLLGWRDEKRYLILAQNPAELRPAGGYAGTVGIVSLRDGELVGLRFTDVYDLDLQKDLPFVRPPDDLIDYVLGEPEAADEAQQSWRLADAAWSPDFPTAARQAAELYAIETDGDQVDGVIAITTFALDRLLEVVGPVDVPGFDVVVGPGDVTLTLIEATRPGAGPTSPSELAGRKDVLDALARTVTRRLMSLPPGRWVDLAEALTDIGAQRMAMVWLADEEAQRRVQQSGWAGAVRQDAGDFVYVVESNVAPTSKFNLVVDRSDSLVVTLDEHGDALDSLRLDWQNDAAKAGEPYDTLRAASQNGPEGWYGAYVRVLVSRTSELITVSGMATDPISGVERLEEEAARSVFGNSLIMLPGPSRLTYLWQVPGAAVSTESGWQYHLLVQRQPGARPVPLSIRVDLPAGAVVSEASDGATVVDGRVSLTTELLEDVELRILYELP